jgi:TrmH family RNA methyltransferase
VEPIKSRRNQRLVRVRRLLSERRARAREGLVAVEGEDLVAAALAAGVRPVDVLAAAGAPLDGALVAAVEPVLALVEPELLAEAGTLGHAARIIAVVRQEDLPGPPAQTPDVALALHGVADPGNVGTLLRSMAMLGPGAVAVGPASADPLGPRAVRASMGAIFHVPLLRTPEPERAFPGTRTVALTADADARLDGLDLTGPVTFLVGAERQGLPEALARRADVQARIPIELVAGIDSLNAAMAGTIALYERRRQLAGPA